MHFQWGRGCHTHWRKDAAARHAIKHQPPQEVKATVAKQQLRAEHGRTIETYALCTRSPAALIDKHGPATRATGHTVARHHTQQNTPCGQGWSARVHAACSYHGQESPENAPHQSMICTWHRRSQQPFRKHGCNRSGPHWSRPSDTKRSHRRRGTQRHLRQQRRVFLRN
eukprot:UN3515